MLFLSRKLPVDHANLTDLAPTIMRFFEVAPSPEMEGRSLW